MPVIRHQLSERKALGITSEQMSTYNSDGRRINQFVEREA